MVQRSTIVRLLSTLLCACWLPGEAIQRALAPDASKSLVHDDSYLPVTDQGWAGTLDDATLLLQDFVKVQPANGSSLDPQLAALGAFSFASPELAGRVRTARQRLEDLTVAARNTTDGLVSALQFAAIMAEMRQFRHLTPHLHPSVHVARKLRPRLAEAAAPEDDRAIFEEMRFWIVMMGTGLVLLPMALGANRKKLTLSALGKAASETLPAEACGSDPHGGGGKKDLDVWDGTVATFSCMVGTGLLAMPYAFSLAGMIAGPILIFFVVCSAYTAKLLSWSMNRSGQFFLGVLVEDAFGPFARKAVDAFMAVELWSYLLSSLVCGSLNVGQLSDELDGPSAVVAFALAVYLLSFVPAQTMTQVSVLSNVVFMLCCGMFLLTGFMLPEKAPVGDVHFIKPQGLLSAAGILVFSPAGHSFYPAVLGRMKEPDKFPQCVNRAYGAVLCLYLVVAVSGYWLFGSATQPSAVLNIGADLTLNPLPALGWMGGLAATGLVIKMLALAVLCLSTLVSTLQNAFADTTVGSKLGPGMLSAVVTPVLLMTSTAVAVHFANDVARLLNLLGSVFCMNIAFVLPVILYWRVAAESIGICQRVFLVSLALMGGVLAVVGLISAL